MERGGGVAQAMVERGFDCVGLEYSQDAINAAKTLNPNLCVIQGDMSVWCEPGVYDFIFSREVYLFTRVNAFSDQLGVVERVVSSLKPGGVFVLLASDVSYPHCADYDLLIKTMRKSGACVYGKYYEFILRKFSRFVPCGKVFSNNGFFRGKFVGGETSGDETAGVKTARGEIAGRESILGGFANRFLARAVLWALHMFFYPIAQFKKRRNWALQYAIVFQRVG